GVEVTQFTQTDITSGDIRFVHDGSDNPPSYSVNVSDGALTTPTSPATIFFTPVNDAPTVTLNQLTIEQDGGVTLSVGENVSANDPDDAFNDFEFRVSKLTGGQFELRAQPGTGISSFSGADLAAGNVIFVHDGSQSAPSYSLVVSDGKLESAPSEVTVNFSPNEGTEFFNDEDTAAENFAGDTMAAAIGSVGTTPHRPDNTEAPIPEVEETPDITDGLLFEFQQKQLDDAATKADQPRLFVNSFDNTQNEDKEQRDSTKSLLQRAITNQLKIAFDTTEPILENIDASFELMSAVIDSTKFKNNLDLLRQDVSSNIDLDQVKIGSSIAVSTGLSIGYVVWLIRGGVLVSSMLSALPAWRFIDPLPILAFGGGDEDEDQESLESLVKNSANEDQSKKSALDEEPA
ncbi:MAG: cadherin-like domain-containing protein, partial [Pseudomonadota bacterium]